MTKVLIIDDGKRATSLLYYLKMRRLPVLFLNHFTKCEAHPTECLVCQFAKTKIEGEILSPVIDIMEYNKKDVELIEKLFKSLPKTIEADNEK